MFSTRQGWKTSRCREARQITKNYWAGTCTATSSGTQREFWMDLAASSAVNFPISSACLRLVVIWIGARSIRSTYSGTRLPRFTFTTNLVFRMVLLIVRDNDREANTGLLPFSCPLSMTESEPILRQLAIVLGFKAVRRSSILKTQFLS